THTHTHTDLVCGMVPLSPGSVYSIIIFHLVTRQAENSPKRTCRHCKFLSALSLSFFLSLSLSLSLTHTLSQIDRASCVERCALVLSQDTQRADLRECVCAVCSCGLSLSLFLSLSLSLSLSHTLPL